MTERIIKPCHFYLSAESKVRPEVENGLGSTGSVVTVVLEKAGGGAGLGFGLDGGRDSPRGDCPLTIKKLFAGTCSVNLTSLRPQFCSSQRGWSCFLQKVGLYRSKIINIRKYLEISLGVMILDDV